MRNNFIGVPNIDDDLAKQLMIAGIFTYESLLTCGSRQAWLKIKAFLPSADLKILMALEGAIQNISDQNLSTYDKQVLKAFYENNK